MTTGALIFANNNQHIDYVAMANWSAKNIQRHLDIPVKIVTDQINTNDATRWFPDFDLSMSWHNHSRVTAYDISPWDRTLVLDADYVIASNSLLTVLDSAEDFLCFRQAYDVAGVDNFSGFDSFGDVAMPMWWATVMCFSKTDRAKMIFDTMTMIKNNWTHYRKIYKIRQFTYRNDYALSMALCLVNGHFTNFPAIPWNMATVTTNHQLKQLDLDHYRVDFVSQNNKPRWIDLHQHDFHAMGKKQLGDIVASHS